MAELENGVTRRRTIVEACLTLYIYYCLLTVFIIIPPVAFAAAGMPLMVRAGTAITLAGVVVAEALALWMAVAYFRRRQISLHDAGWRKPTRSWAIIAAIVAAMAYSAWTAQLPEVGKNLYEISLLKLWGVVAGIFGAVVEEIIFRGYLLHRFAQAGMSKPSQVVFAAVCFGLLHMEFGLWGVFCTTVLGILLGLLYVYGNRSLTGPLQGDCAMLGNLRN